MLDPSDFHCVCVWGGGGGGGGLNKWQNFNLEVNYHFKSPEKVHL